MSKSIPQALVEFEGNPFSHFASDTKTPNERTIRRCLQGEVINSNGESSELSDVSWRVRHRGIVVNAGCSFQGACARGGAGLSSTRSAVLRLREASATPIMRNFKTSTG